MISRGCRLLSTTTLCHAEFSHAVVGAGIVGLAIAAELQAVPGNSVVVVDQHGEIAQETTSRNSEVIHAGIYYPPNLLKAKLCIAGKEKIYAEPRSQFPVDYQQCGKWVVAQDEEEAQYLDNLYKRCQTLGVPVEFKSKRDVTRYPHLRAAGAVLELPTTGIISAHDYATYFLLKFEEAGGTTGLNSRLEAVEFTNNEYLLALKDAGGEEFTLSADCFVNSAGLHAARVANMLLPQDRHFGSYFAKGNYFSYTPSKPMGTITDKLIYPVPNPNAVSLGTHLTFDLGGQIRFGPDLEWLETDDADKIDYTPSATNIPAAVEAIRTYFPSIKAEELAPAYLGVRPKLKSRTESAKGFVDYYIKEEEGFPGFVNLVGIESPGLTSSWAIADYVRDIYHK